MRTRYTLLAAAALLALGGCVTPPLLPDQGPEAALPDPVVSTQVFVYPTQSQSGAQLDRDRYECNSWAVRQTGFDPSLPSVAPHQRTQVVSVSPQGSDILPGAATGAIIGAAVSRPRAAGEGAVLGAIAGTLLGAASDQARQQQAAAINQRLGARDYAGASSYEARASNFRRALSACLEGRGYTVK
jgi:hypothetical protein